MKWAVDKIIDNIVVIENIVTQEKRELDINTLSFPIHEGSILIYNNDEYQLDESEEERRRRLIVEKFKRLRNNK